MKFDDASWHYGGDFPANLPRDAAATHAGMFLAWAILAGLGSESHAAGATASKGQLERKLITPGQLLVRACDEKLTDEDLNAEGIAFAEVYFDLSNGDYLADYEKTVGSDLPSLYHVPDTWDTYMRLKPVLDARFAKWKASKKK